MMKKLLIAGIAMLTIAISSCDEDTTTMGYSLTGETDRFTVVSDTFNVSTCSFAANPDSILSISEYSYIGQLKDPETGTYITSDFSTQFAILENESDYIFAPDSLVLGRDTIGKINADSCFLNVIINAYQGDSLAAMKLTVMELDKPIEENKFHYASFDPEKEGYVRTDGLKQNKLYTMTDLMLSDSIRNIRQASGYYDYISIPLNQPYTDKQGNHYNNYGTYLMRTYYEHPEYFKNSATFINNVCPGFYLKTTDGLGLMAEVLNTQLVVDYHFKSDTLIYTGAKTFYGTEEVMQTTHITNNKKQIDSLVNINRYTYLKTPAGIFTEVTLPVEDIMRGHENDTITLAEISFQRMNDNSEMSDILLEEPQNLLMVESDSIYSFFRNRSMNDNKTSYLATYNSTSNSYSYYNIASLITHMYDKRNSGSSNWNKVMLIPVQTTTTATSSYSTSTTVTSISNEMSITSVRLVGGSGNQHQPVHINVIYNKGE